MYLEELITLLTNKVLINYKAPTEAASKIGLYTKIGQTPLGINTPIRLRYLYS